MWIDGREATDEQIAALKERFKEEGFGVMLMEKTLIRPISGRYETQTKLEIVKPKPFWALAVAMLVTLSVATLMIEILTIGNARSIVTSLTVGAVIYLLIPYEYCLRLEFRTDRAGTYWKVLPRYVEDPKHDKAAFGLVYETTKHIVTF